MGGEREQVREPSGGGEPASEEQSPGTNLRAHAMKKRAIQRKKDGEAGDKAEAAGAPDGEEKKEEKKGEEAAKPKEPLKAGETGILTAVQAVKIADKDQELAPGTVVEVMEDKGEELKVKVYSGQDGAEAVIPEAKFQKQPGVAISSKTQKPRGDVYKEFKGKLWSDDGPKPGDVAQGAIADCYLIAALGSVCAANPAQIQKLITPHQPGLDAYTVTLYKQNEDTGDIEPTQIAVDTKLPSLNKAKPEGDKPELAYAGMGETEDSTVLWPSIIEKAYAQLVGGYAEAGKGGFARDGLLALTGEKPKDRGLPDKDQVLETFKEHEKGGKAVVCGTLGSMSNKTEKGFAKAGEKYEATLKTHEGEPCSLLPNKVKVRDDVSKDHKLNTHDDGKGKFLHENVDEGSVEYSSGKVSFKFKDGKAPESPENLTASYDFRGVISKDLNLHAWHMYIFEKVDGENLIFKNPWGTEHPKPIPAEQFTKLFTGVTSVTVPKEDEAPPGA